MKIYDFVKFADCACFCDFSEGFEIYAIRFSLIVSFVGFEMEYVVVAAGAEAFGVDLHFSFAAAAGC